MAKKTPDVGEMMAWKWLTGVAEGKVTEVRHGRTEIVSKGKHIVRYGTEKNPAVVMMHKNGNPVIKLLSELL